MSKKDDEIGMIFVSQKTWDKIKNKFPSSIESIFPNMGFINSIPIRVSNFVEDNKIIPIPKGILDTYKDMKFQSPKFEIKTEPLWMQMIGV